MDMEERSKLYSLLKAENTLPHIQKLNKENDYRNVTNWSLYQSAFIEQLLLHLISILNPYSATYALQD